MRFTCIKNLVQLLFSKNVTLSATNFQHSTEQKLPCLWFDGYYPIVVCTNGIRFELVSLLHRLLGPLDPTQHMQWSEKIIFIIGLNEPVQCEKHIHYQNRPSVEGALVRKSIYLFHSSSKLWQIERMQTRTLDIGLLHHSKLRIWINKLIKENTVIIWPDYEFGIWIWWNHSI